MLFTCRLFGVKFQSELDPELLVFATVMFAHQMRQCEQAEPGKIIRVAGKLYEVKKVVDRTGERKDVVLLRVWGYNITFPWILEEVDVEREMGVAID